MTIESESALASASTSGPVSVCASGGMSGSAKIVLIVSELNAISQAFHRFPQTPVGIIEMMHASDTTARVHSPCRRYCERYSLAHAFVSRQNLAGIETYLTKWQATLVVTHSVPVLPMSLIDPLRHGGINLHHSRLPAYRGGNPLLWQVIEEVPRIGVSVHVLTRGADEGAVLAQCEFDRPSAVSKQKLANIANQHYGVELLKQVIPAWVEQSITACEQPESSPTLQANHFPFENLLTLLSTHAVSLNGLWDVACFLEHWPPESVPSTLWCSWFRWVPESIARGCSKSRHDDRDFYQLRPIGLRLHLRHRDGCVVFRPRFHWGTVLAKLLL